MRITVSQLRITGPRLDDTEFSLPNRITRVRLGDTDFSLLKCITKGKKADFKITATKFSKTPVIHFHYKNVSPISLLKCITNFIAKVYHHGEKRPSWKSSLRKRITEMIPSGNESFRYQNVSPNLTLD